MTIEIDGTIGEIDVARGIAAEGARSGGEAPNLSHISRSAPPTGAPIVCLPAAEAAGVGA
ncbi:MAG TPA: hypothetical protein VF877_02665 [Gaiellaceae bacterium]